MYLDSSEVERSYVKREAQGSMPGSGLYFSVTQSPKFHELANNSNPHLLYLGGRMLREHTSSLLIMSNHKTHNKKPIHTRIYI